jgi:PAS domain S-box-containing protein
VSQWNAATEALFGWSADEARGRAATPELCALATRAARGETISGVDATHARKDGAKVTVRVSVSPLRNALGMPLGVVAAFTRVE